MSPIIVIGGGGHAKVLIDALLCAAAPVLGYTDPANTRDILGLPHLGDDNVIAKHGAATIQLVNGLGSTGSTQRRREAFERYKALGYTFASVIHPSAIVGRECVLTEGVQIMAGAVIQPGCRIGANTIINTRASVDHDCIIGAHVHLAPGTTLSGCVNVEDGCHLGTGANVIQGRRIGAGSVVGAGSLVLNDVTQGSVVGGVPARLLRP